MNHHPNYFAIYQILFFRSHPLYWKEISFMGYYESKSTISEKDKKFWEDWIMKLDNEWKKQTTFNNINPESKLKDSSL